MSLLEFGEIKVIVLHGILYLNCFPSGGFTGDDGDGAGGDVVVGGEEGDEGLVGFAVHGWGGEADFERVAVHSDDFGLGGAGDDVDGEAHGN